MAKTLQLIVLTQAGKIESDEAVAVRAPGGLGYFGVLYNHAPLVSTVMPGELRWRCPDGSIRTLQVGSGILEVAHNRVTLLISSATEPGQTS